MSTNTRLGAVVSVLALIVLAMALHIAWQTMRLSALTSELQQAKRELEFGVVRNAQDDLRGRRDEMAKMIAWLDEFYRAPEGLQRPAGLWLPEERRIDADAIAVWILDVYLPARVAGQSDQSARQSVIDAIKTTDEWQRRHAASGSPR
jgi:hypothetical protein